MHILKKYVSTIREKEAKLGESTREEIRRGRKEEREVERSSHSDLKKKI